MNAMFFEYIRPLGPLTIRYSHLRVVVWLFIIYELCTFQMLFRVELISKDFRDLSWSSLYIIQVFVPDLEPFEGGRI